MSLFSHYFHDFKNLNEFSIIIRILLYEKWTKLHYTMLHYCRKLETELDEDIEKKGEVLDRENIKANRAYKECFTILKKFDVENHQFFKEVEYLLNVYADAAKNVNDFYIIYLFCIIFHNS